MNPRCLFSSLVLAGLFWSFVAVLFAVCSTQPPEPAPPLAAVTRAHVVLAVERFGAAAVEIAATEAARRHAPVVLATLDADGSGSLSVAEILQATWSDPQVLAVAVAAALLLKS